MEYRLVRMLAHPRQLDVGGFSFLITNSNTSFKFSEMPRFFLHREAVIYFRSGADASEVLSYNFLLLNFLLHTSSRITTTFLFSKWPCSQLDATEESLIFSMLYTAPWRYFSGLASCPRQIFSTFSFKSLTSWFHINIPLQPPPPPNTSTLLQKYPSPVWYLVFEAQGSEVIQTRQVIISEMRVGPSRFSLFQRLDVQVAALLWPLAFGTSLPIHFPHSLGKRSKGSLNSHLPMLFLLRYCPVKNLGPGGRLKCLNHLKIYTIYGLQAFVY